MFCDLTKRNSITKDSDKKKSPFSFFILKNLFLFVFYFGQAYFFSLFTQISHRLEVYG